MFKDLLKVSKISDFIIVSERPDREAISQAEIQLKYSGYIDKEIKKNVEKINRLENLKIPDGFDFMSMKSYPVRRKRN